MRFLEETRVRKPQMIPHLSLSFIIEILQICLRLDRSATGDLIKESLCLIRCWGFLVLRFLKWWTPPLPRFQPRCEFEHGHSDSREHKRMKRENHGELLDAPKMIWFVGKCPFEMWSSNLAKAFFMCRPWISPPQPPTVVCSICKRDGHLKDECPEDFKKIELKPLPPMNESFREILDRLCRFCYCTYSSSPHRVSLRRSLFWQNQHQIDHFICFCRGNIAYFCRLIFAFCLTSGVDSRHMIFDFWHLWLGLEPFDLDRLDNFPQPKIKHYTIYIRVKVLSWYLHI